MKRKLTKKELEIFRLIISAQACSDWGKGFDNQYLPGRRHVKVTRGGYADKLTYILRAIAELNGSKEQLCISWFVEPGTFITYFDIMLRDVEIPFYAPKHIQVSFHTPCGVPGYEQLYRFAGKGRKTVWNHKLGGSINACEILGHIIEEVKL